jgi:hypothetical protein
VEILESIFSPYGAMKDPIPFTSSTEVSMSWSPGEYPVFSLSHSRIENFEWCHRRYALAHYYGWRGWERGPESPPLQQLAYRLKQLNNFHSVFGTAIHLECERVVKAIRDGTERPTAADVVGRIEAAIGRAYTLSLDRRAFLADPKRHPIVHSAYYRGVPDRTELEKVRAKISPCVRNLVKSDFWDEVRGLEPGEFRAIEKLDDFELEGVRVWVKADLITSARCGDVTLVDFKTSSSDDGVYRPQLLLYALYARDKLEIPFRDDYWTACVVNLCTGTIDRFTVTQDDLVEAEKRLRRATAGMRELLLDEKINRPMELEHFPLAHKAQQGTCPYCPFFQLCAPALGGGVGLPIRR